MMLLIRMMILMTLLLVWRKLVDCCKRRLVYFWQNMNLPHHITICRLRRVSKKKVHWSGNIFHPKKKRRHWKTFFKFHQTENIQILSICFTLILLAFVNDWTEDYMIPNQMNQHQGRHINSLTILSIVPELYLFLTVG